MSEESENSAAFENPWEDWSAQDQEDKDGPEDNFTTSALPPLPPPQGIQLTDEQSSAVDRIISWVTDPLSPQEFKLGGYAGTGKTTVAKAIRERLRDLRLHCSFCAFTGKAVNVLQRKGIYEAQTCHSLMYDVDIDPKTGAISFSRKPRLEGRNDVLVNDESSMLSTELYNDLKSYNIKLLFIGDPGQLEPVGDNPDLMRHPDVVLSKIHRQAEQSPIIRFANNVRLGSRPTPMVDGDLIVRAKSGLTIPALIDMGIDQVICAKNKTRTEVNTKYRLALNKPLDHLEPLDKIIVLRNNTQCGVFNGMILFIDEVLQDEGQAEFGWWKVNAHDEIKRKFLGIRVWKKPFMTELPKDFIIPKYDKIPLVYADWGYCITCHKSQGSEWDHVLVWDEWMPPQVWDMKRWRYTAITRAAKKLTYCL